MGRLLKLGPDAGDAALRDGLNALGYKEGEQYVIGVRFTRVT
jgi:hypothetical protein